jgi:predicted permease
MRRLAYLRSLVDRFWQRSRMEHELEEELRSHIEHRADDLARAGLDRAAADRQARVEFGGRERVKEDCRETLGGLALETLIRDVRYSLRVLRKSPGFTLVAVVTLALALGANAIVFAALNAAILRPLDVPRAESLYSIHRVTDESAAQSYPDYVDLRDRNRSFEELAAYNIVQAGLDTGEATSSVWLAAVSGNYFDVLGVQPYLGRVFHRSDERGPNSAPYIVIAHSYWHSRFRDDPSVVGRVVQLNKHPFTIIGVAPPGFRGTLLFFTPDIFFPMMNLEQLAGPGSLEARANRWIFMTMGHLKPGVTPEQAAADVNGISAALEEAYPKDHRHVPVRLGRPSLYGNYMGRPVRAFLGALMLLAALILLAACANLGSLFAARAADRSREVALRLALGASRLRVLRQIFTEGILISLAGGALGLWGSIVLLQWVRAWRPFPQFPINLPVSPDANVYIAALLLAIVSGLLFGAVPVRQVIGTNPFEIVKAGSRCTPGGRVTIRDVLVVAQIAICAVLVTASMVAVRGLVRSMHSHFGFEPRDAMLVRMDLDMAGYRGEAVGAMQKRILDAVETLPGVAAVGLADWVPLAEGGVNSALTFTDDTADLRAANAAVTAVNVRMSPGYLRAAGTPLLSGRNITVHDDGNAPRVAVVNLEFARKVFGSANSAIGRYYKLRDGTRVQVVGLVEDGKYGTLTENPMAVTFVPILQSRSSDTKLVVRSSRDPQELAAAIKAQLRQLDAGLPSFIEPWNQALDLPLFPARVATVVLGVLGAMGAMLSITGVFGMAAYSVSSRLKELGIRIAIGAQRRQVLQAALGRAVTLLTLGSTAGLVLGFLASRVLSLIVYQATPRDPLVLVGVVVAMLILGLLATSLPARRALSVDPLTLLREE